MSGEIIDVEGGKRWVATDGAGSPAVVFESAIGDVGLTWGLVMPAVAERTSVLTWDRPGLGRSEPSSSPRTLDTTVAELRATLAAAGLAPPFVLVGHSFASLTVRAFTALHIDEVIGLVLVDGAHEDQMQRFPPEFGQSEMLAGVPVQLRQFADAARRGEPIPELTPVPGAFPADLAAEYREATRPTPTRLETAAEEYESLIVDQNRMRGLAARGRLDIPLVAIRHGIPQPMPGVPDDVNREYEATWVTLQEELAASTSRGEVRIADGAGHLVHHDRPDVVAAAVADVIARR